jgi:hypothetical protein
MDLLRTTYKDSYLTYLLSHLTPLAEYGDVKIYKFPRMNQQNKESDVAFITPTYRDKNFMEKLYYIYDLIATSGISYSILLDQDLEALKKSMLILPIDPPYIKMIFMTILMTHRRSIKIGTLLESGV